MRQRHSIRFRILFVLLMNAVHSKRKSPGEPVPDLKRLTPSFQLLHIFLVIGIHSYLMAAFNLPPFTPQIRPSAAGDFRCPTGLEVNHAVPQLRKQPGNFFKPFCHNGMSTSADRVVLCHKKVPGRRSMCVWAVESNGSEASSSKQGALKVAITGEDERCLWKGTNMRAWRFGGRRKRMVL